MWLKGTHCAAALPNALHAMNVCNLVAIDGNAPICSSPPFDSGEHVRCLNIEAFIAEYQAELKYQYIAVYRPVLAECIRNLEEAPLYQNLRIYMRTRQLGETSTEFIR